MGKRFVCIQNLLLRQHCLQRDSASRDRNAQYRNYQGCRSLEFFLADVNFSSRKLNIGGGFPGPGSDVKRAPIVFQESTLADQQIRDQTNKLMATVKTLSSGKQEIRDARNKLLGTYDPRANETRDASNRLVARGNVLTSLIRPF